MLPLLMRRAAAACFGLAIVSASAAAQRPLADTYRQTADRIISAALGDSSAFARLTLLTDRFGHRLSGSTGLESAIDWILTEMRSDGLDSVRGEPVMVPHWVRGEEWALLVAPRPYRLHILGLGRSVGTPPEGITAPVIVVGSFAELESRSNEARGKIVLFDVPFTTYGATVRYRSTGASAAARAGAVAALVRSVTPLSMQTPHTGALNYDTAAARIPAAALSVEDAMLLRRMVERGDSVVVTLRMSASTLPDAASRNVVAEIRGSEKPEEIVVLGGHIDSWDVGQGAMDDAGGSVAAWEAVRIIRKLGLRPRRTIRVVLWTNEENGLRGATAYRDTHAGELDRHVMAMESDNGIFQPRGYHVAGGDSAMEVVRQVASLAGRIRPMEVSAGGPEADVSVLHARGVPALALQVDATKYFWYHHSDADTIDKLNPRDMAECVALMAVVAYVVADMPGTLGRAPPLVRSD